MLKLMLVDADGEWTDKDKILWYHSFFSYHHHLLVVVLVYIPNLTFGITPGILATPHHLQSLLHTTDHPSSSLVMSKCVNMPSGPLVAKDNLSPTKMVGIHYQYPPVDLVDPETHCIAEGQAVGGGQEVPLEVVSPNELKRLEAVGRKAAIKEVFQKTEFVSPDEIQKMGKAERKALVQHEAQKIDLVSPNKAKALQMAEMWAMVQQEFGKQGMDTTIRLPGPDTTVRSPSSTPTPGIGNWIQGVQPDPESGLALDRPCNFQQVGMSVNDAIAAACNVKVEWDILEGAESYSADMRELASIICAKLNHTLSKGKDSIVQAVADNNMDDASTLLEAAEQSMLVNAEGYSRYESFEPFRMLADLRIRLKQTLVADLGTITGSILAAGSGTQKDISMGDWPLILDCDLWFRFVISCLGNIAKAGARFKDFPSRRKHVLAIGSEAMSFTLGDEFEVPVMQSKMMQRLLKQIYAQLDERNDCSTLEERAKYVQEKSLDGFEWLVQARVALKSVFLGQYLPEADVKAIMEQILLEHPKGEIMDSLWGMWRNEVDETVQREGAKFKHKADEALAKYKVQIEEQYAEELEQFKANRRLYYDRLDKIDQRNIVTQQAIALGLVEHSELRERESKKVKTSRSSSIVSLKKRGRSVSRSEDLPPVNLVSYSATPSQKTKDGSITPTRASVDVPIATYQGTVAQRNVQQTRSNAHLVERLRAWL